MVRLIVMTGKGGMLTKLQFQFHDGTIDSHRHCMNRYQLHNQFQFHDGTIDSGKRSFIQFARSYFNSTMVRLIVLAETAWNH